MVTCNQCGESGLEWEKFGESWRLINFQGLIHNCDPAQEENLDQHLRNVSSIENIELLRKIYLDVSRAIYTGYEPASLPWLIAREKALSIHGNSLKNGERN